MSSRAEFAQEFIEHLINYPGHDCPDCVAYREHGAHLGGAQWVIDNKYPTERENNE